MQLFIWFLARQSLLRKSKWAKEETTISVSDLANKENIKREESRKKSGEARKIRLYYILIENNYDLHLVVCFERISIYFSMSDSEWFYPTS